jgi:hypothetical protein
LNIPYDIKIIPIGSKVVFYHGVKSKKIPEGRIGIIKGYKYLSYLNNKSGEKEYTILYDVELPNGKVHRTQARCIMRLSDWDNPSVREAMLKEKEKEEAIEGSANQNW